MNTWAVYKLANPLALQWTSHPSIRGCLDDTIFTVGSHFILNVERALVKAVSLS